MQSENDAAVRTEPKPRFEGLVLRVRSALVLLPFVILPIWFGGLAFLGLLILACLAMAYEWTHLLQSPRARADAFILTGAVGTALIVSEFFSVSDGFAFLVSLLPAMAAYCLWRGDKLSALVGGLVYLGWPLLALHYFRQDTLGALLVGFIFLTVWGVDIFAMFSGKFIGGPKLAPRLSPNKTWAGLFGAMGGAALAACLGFVVVVGFGFGTAGFQGMLVLAVISAIVAQMADLFESALKRKYDIKDSGALIPGHGGVLDRVDGLVGVLMFLHVLVLVRGAPASMAIWNW